MRTLFSDSSHLNSASMPLYHETRQGSGDLKVHNKLPFDSLFMTPKQSTSTDIGHITLKDECKTNIRAVFLREDQRLHDLHESQLPKNRESKEGNKNSSTLYPLGWFIMLLTFRLHVDTVSATHRLREHLLANYTYSS